MKNNLDKTNLEITQKLEQQEREKYTKRYNNLNYVDFSNPNADKISSASTTTIKQETLEEVGEYQQELFNYLYDLGVTALQTEMQEIERIVLGMQKETTFEEEAKQETLEEAAKNESEYLADWEDKEMYQKGFIQGAKWQQERMYSEEEVMDILLLSYSSISDKSLAGADLRKWFEQFKNK